MNLSSRCAKVSADAQLRRNKERVAHRDGPFVAAVSGMCFHSHFATKGRDSSLYHSAVCYSVWSQSWPEGRNVCLAFSVAWRWKPCITRWRAGATVCFGVHSSEECVHADVHTVQGFFYQVSETILQTEFHWITLVHRQMEDESSGPPWLPTTTSSKEYRSIHVWNIIEKVKNIENKWGSAPFWLSMDVKVWKVMHFQISVAFIPFSVATGPNLHFPPKVQFKLALY